MAGDGSASSPPLSDLHISPLSRAAAGWQAKGTSAHLWGKDVVQCVSCLWGQGSSVVFSKPSHQSQEVCFHSHSVTFWDSE